MISVRTGDGVLRLMAAAMPSQSIEIATKRSHPGMSQIWLSCLGLLCPVGSLPSSPADGGGRKSFVWIPPDRVTAEVTARV